MPDFDARGTVPVGERFVEGGHDQRGHIGGAPPAPTPTPSLNGPRVANVQPSLNSALTPEQELRFDVIDDDDDLFDVVIFAIFVSTGDWEVIWDGEQFSPRYLQQSGRQAITNGFRYNVRRAGNWPEKPKLRLRAFDSNLNRIS